MYLEKNIWKKKKRNREEKLFFDFWEQHRRINGSKKYNMA